MSPSGATSPCFGGTGTPVLERCFASQLASDGWQQRLNALIPSYGQDLNADAELLVLLLVDSTTTRHALLPVPTSARPRAMTQLYSCTLAYAVHTVQSSQLYSCTVYWYCR